MLKRTGRTNPETIAKKGRESIRRTKTRTRKDGSTKKHQNNNRLKKSNRMGILKRKLTANDNPIEKKETNNGRNNHEVFAVGNVTFQSWESGKDTKNRCSDENRNPVFVKQKFRKFPEKDNPKRMENKQNEPKPKQTTRNRRYKIEKWRFVVMNVAIEDKAFTDGLAEREIDFFIGIPMRLNQRRDPEDEDKKEKYNERTVFCNEYGNLVSKRLRPGVIHCFIVSWFH